MKLADSGRYTLPTDDADYKASDSTSLEQGKAARWQERGRSDQLQRRPAANIGKQ